MSGDNPTRPNPVEERDASERRVALAKSIAEKCIRLVEGPSLVPLPSDLKAVVGEFALLVVDLARNAHAKFDYYPFDLRSVSDRVDRLVGMLGDDGGVPSLIGRVAELERRLDALEKKP